MLSKKIPIKLNYCYNTFFIGKFFIGSSFFKELNASNFWLIEKQLHPKIYRQNHEKCPKKNLMTHKVWTFLSFIVIIPIQGEMLEKHESIPKQVFRDHFLCLGRICYAFQCNLRWWLILIFFNLDHITFWISLV